MVSGASAADFEDAMRLSMDHSYGVLKGRVERLAKALAVAAVGAMVTMSGAMAQGSGTAPIKLAVLGDSLTAGHGLSSMLAFPPRLQAALKDKGIATDILNAGVSGDTTTGGLARLDWSIPEGTQGVILELGANDALRGVDPKVTYAALDGILKKLKARNIPVLLTGMYAPPNFGADYVKTFNAIYPDLAKAYGVPLYPFFLEGVATDPKLNQGDGIHPTAEGVDAIVTRILPMVEAFLKTLPQK